jgi:hypothetical protein
LAHSINFQRALTAFALQLELQLIYRRIAVFLERNSDALNDNIMDFASFIKGDPAQRNANWVIAWEFWNAPSGEAPLLRRLQARRCGQTGGRLRNDAEVDHRVPLFRVWRDHRNDEWPKLLNYWGLPNLQVINRDVHAAKCASEAQDRRVACSVN